MLDNEINGRYKQLLASMSKDVSDLISETKGTPAKYYRILRGEVKPNYDSLFELMEAYPQINGDWLLTGRGEMFISSNQNGQFLNIDTQSVKKLEQEKEELARRLSESESEKNRILISFLKEKGVEFPKPKGVTSLPENVNLFRPSNPMYQVVQRGLKMAV